MTDNNSLQETIIVAKASEIVPEEPVKCTGAHTCTICKDNYSCSQPSICQMPYVVDACAKCWKGTTFKPGWN